MSSVLVEVHHFASHTSRMICSRVTTKEFDLLWILLRDAGKVVTREQIMREVWDAKWWTSTKTLDMHISWLRRKLGDDAHSPRYITTVRGVGFRFERGDKPG